MNSMNGRRLSLAVLGAFTLTSAAHGQPAATGNSGGDDGTLGEIVVTAEKRAESLQKTAAAVTAMSADMLVARGVRDLRAAQMVVPAVRFQKEGFSTQVFVRGVGANQDLAPIEQNVAFNFNGVYVPREGTTTGFFDLAGMEVLPGPQGTLYGRSAVGGTVNVTFAKPAFDWRGSTLAEVGNHGMWSVSVAQNIPVSDTLAFRVAGDVLRHDGYMATGADSADDKAGRLSMLYAPNEAVSVYLWSQYGTKDGAPPNLVNKGTDPVTGQYREDAFLNDDPWNEFRYGQWANLPFPFSQPTESRGDYEAFLTGGQIDWDMGSMTLTYIPSYIFVDARNELYWLGVLPAKISQKYNMTSHELRLSGGENSSLEWLAGLYAYNQRNGGLFTIFQDVFGPFGLVNSNVPYNRLEGVSGFGQATYSFTDQARVTLGARYSSDKREANGSLTADPVTGAPIGNFTFDEDYSNVDWKVSAEYDVAPEAMVYAAIQTGYAPGTYNTTPTSATDPRAPAVKPIDLTAFSLGLKSRVLDGTLQFNPELFYYDYRNLILQQYDISQTFNPVFNAQEIRIWGAQVDVLWKPTPNGEFNLNIGYTHARNEEFVTPNGEDYSGLQPPYAPDTTILAGYQHRFPLGSGALLVRVDGRYESAWFADYVHNPGVRQEPSTKGDALVTYESDRDWSVGIWVKNFSNRAVLAATAAAGFPGPATAYLEAPRTYGLRFNVNYGSNP